MRTYNKTKSHQNIPRRNSASEQNWNPINSSSMSTSDTGIVSLSKGNVYYDLNDNAGAKGTESYSKILVRDEYGNLVELLRSSDIEDTSALGSYVNNQTIHNYPNERLGYVDGRPSNAEKDSNIKFTFEVDTNSQTLGSEEEVISDTNQFQLPLVANGTISMNVDWGDGASDVITTYNQAETLHTYAASGVYTIKIANEVRGWKFDYGGDKLKINDISNWGQFNITQNSSFYGCSNLTAAATDSPTIESTNLFRTFRGCYLFNGVVNNWNIRDVVNTQQMFHDCFIFNQPLSNWNTSSVIYMNYMFANCENFNQPLNNWNLSSAQRMFGFFYGAHKFNQPLNNWDVSSVTEMSYMFFRAYEFNQSLNNWDVSSVTLTLNMFYQAYDFNQPLSFWDTSSFVRIEGMFAYATNFNQDLGNWNIESVTSMNDVMLGVTLGTSNYDSLLTGWLGSPTLIDPEFITNGDFNDGLTGWTLTGAASATQTLVAGGLEMYSGTVADNSNRMSQTSTPQGYINKTYTLTLDAYDFVGATSGYIRLDGVYDSSNIISFNASTTSVTFVAYRDFTYIKFFASSSNKYYTVDNISLKEALNTPPLDLTPNFGNSEYKFYGDAETARNELVNDYGWTITDGGGVLPVDESFEFSVDTNSQTLGTEIIDNSDFSLGDVVWIKSAGWSIADGQASRDGTGISNTDIRQAIPVVNGKTYEFSYTRTYASGGGETNIYVQTNGSNYVTLGSYNSTVVEEHTVTGQFTALFTGNMLWKMYGIGTFTGILDNVSVKEVISDTDQFQLPLISSGDINMVVHWGDATTSNITSYNQAETLHTYPSAGTYTINIYREVKGWQFANGGDKFKMRAISNWGGFNVSNSQSFYGCASMTCTATTAPIVSATDLQQTFRNCHLFDGAIGNWDVRNVTNFYTLLYGCNVFNQPLNNWDTSSATMTRFMFYACNEFNQPINNWEMKSVGNMGYMFLNATNFDQNISQWDITSATDMTSFMQGVTLSTANYDELLMQWEDSGSVQEPELISNGDFSEEGVELTTNGDFATNSDWNGVGSNGWSIDTDLQQLNAVSATGYVYQGLGTVTGKSYKIVVDATLTSGGCKVKGFNATDVININIIGRNTYTGYFTETDSNPNLGFNTLGSQFTGSIHSISVKEVGQDWSLGTGWSIADGKASNDGTGSYSSLMQDNITTTSTIGRTFKITLTVEDYVSGKVRVGVGGYDRVTVEVGNGEYVKYIEVNNPSANKRFYTTTWGAFIGSISNVSVKEVLNSPPIGITTNFGGSRYTAEAIPARESLVNSYGWTIVDGGESV